MLVNNSRLFLIPIRIGAMQLQTYSFQLVVLISALTNTGYFALGVSPALPADANLQSGSQQTQPSGAPVSQTESTASKDAAAEQRFGNKGLTPPKTTAEDRTSRATARAKGELNFDDLKFDIEKGGKFERGMLPKEIEELNKRTIRIRGFILPQSVIRMTGFEEFVLVRDNMECCFGPGAALYDCIMVKMEKGKKADFTTRPVAVRGKFEIKEFKYPDSDDHYAIYFLTASEVQ